MKPPNVFYYFLLWVASVFAILPVVGWLRQNYYSYGVWRIAGSPIFLPIIGSVEIWVVLLVGLINAVWMFIVITTRGDSTRHLS